MSDTLDTRGRRCPFPVLMAQKRMKALAIGATIEVLADDPASYIDFQHYCAESGNELVEWSEAAGEFRYLLKRTG